MSCSFIVTQHRDYSLDPSLVAAEAKLDLEWAGWDDITVKPAHTRTYWVIREKATRTLFPSAKGNTSYLEFDPALPPRLFTRRQDALTVVRHWIRGHSFQTRQQQNDDIFRTTTTPVEGRCIDKLEIVAVALGDII